MEKERVKVKLVGEDGNAFAILGRVTKAMRRAGWTKAEIDAFTKKAKSGDYDNLLRVVMDHCDDYDPDMDHDEEIDNYGDSTKCPCPNCRS